MIYSARPVSHEGRFAVVTNVEAGCGGRVAVAAWISAPTNDGDAHGQVAWSWHPEAGVTFASALPAPRGQRWPESPAHRGEREEAVKPSHGECRVFSAEPVVPAACIFFAGGPWVRPAPGIPRALFSGRGTSISKARTRERAARKRSHVSAASSQSNRRHCERSDLSAKARRAATEAIQSHACDSGWLRRYAPRNDGERD
jgi:hypothetical protein